MNRLYKHLQATLTPRHAVLVDAGDSWFHATKLALPGDCRFVGWEPPSGLPVRHACMHSFVVPCRQAGAAVGRGVGGRFEVP